MAQRTKQSRIPLYALYLLALGALDTEQATANEYPYLYRSAYFLGRGDTGIATADGEDAVFYNPAGLASGEGIYKKVVLASPMFEISKDTRDIIKQVALQEGDLVASLRNHEGIPQHVGVNTFSGVILRRVALGFFAHNSTTALLYKDPDKGALESFKAASVSDFGTVFSLAQNFGKRWQIGVTTKVFKRNQAAFDINATESEKIKNINSSDELTMMGTGSGVDLGLMYQREGRTGLAWGLTLQDIGNTTLIPDTPTTLDSSKNPLKDIKQTLNMGVAITPGTKTSKIKILADIRDLLGATGQSPYKRYHLGSELSLKDLVGFCAGVNQGYPTFGAYVDIHFLRLDVGAYTEEIGENAGSRPDSRYFIKLHMGL